MLIRNRGTEVILGSLVAVTIANGVGSIALGATTASRHETQTEGENHKLTLAPRITTSPSAVVRTAIPRKKTPAEHLTSQTQLIEGVRNSLPAGGLKLFKIPVSDPHDAANIASIKSIPKSDELLVQVSGTNCVGLAKIDEFKQPVAPFTSVAAITIPIVTDAITQGNFKKYEDNLYKSNGLEVQGDEGIDLGNGKEPIRNILAPLNEPLKIDKNITAQLQHLCGFLATKTS